MADFKPSCKILNREEENNSMHLENIFHFDILVSLFKGNPYKWKLDLDKSFADGWIWLTS